ncbi:hypothetical protein H5392_02125 [Tessaracoccus sp. MC1865]|uniref:hypothetical protein n=1 Tax=Tessaracoccus sp. MC1865 TaxID=2760310 RepID=UPI0016034D04|nr:hypothetical protein [Tessaracoccus sp. MC1865]MBB1482656.1 hypothetical protein [Tessaracoccus sp. MC1865]QTO37893.1 hypothetical protein J7D54_01965 [Tessaracoccus sp. MC1865]
MPIPTPDTEPLDFTTLAQADDGPRDAVSTVLRDHAAFVEFFDGELPMEHPVDWDTEVVTVVALGPRGHGAGVAIEEIQLHTLGIRGGTVDVYFREVAGEVDDATVTYPFHAVRSTAFGHAFFHPVGPADVPAGLFRDWRGPIRTDDDGVGVYVPREEAPLSRSVAGFAVDGSGSFVAVHDAPGDGPVEVPGHWRPAQDGLSVELEDGRAFTLHVVSVDEHELRARIQGVSRPAR